MYFTEEVKQRGGNVTDVFHQGGRLYVRSLLPHVAERATQRSHARRRSAAFHDDELWLHPYLFRQVCRNGAIMAQSIESLHVECLGVYTLEEGSVMLREASPNAPSSTFFETSMRRIRRSAMSEIDELLNIMPHLMQLQRAGMGRYFSEVFQRFIGEGDRTRFGLMNAVTSTARDASDQDDRWRLEELGGGIGALLRPKRPSSAPGREISESTVRVGRFDIQPAHSQSVTQRVGPFLAAIRACRCPCCARR